MNIKRFYREKNRWYIDLPEYLENGGSLEELEMVMGADTLLDTISENEDEVYVAFSLEPFAGFNFLLEKTEEDEYGATYKVSNQFNTKFSVWLCPVTKYVFDGIYPKELYIR